MRRFIADFLASSVVVCIATGALAELPNNYVNALNILIEPDARPTVSNVASGFGASGGQKFLAVSYTDQDLQTLEPGDDDGSIIIGTGFGDPSESVGVEIALGITSVSSPFWGDGKFGDEGNLNLKLHKYLGSSVLGEISSVSFGASNLVGWGATQDIPTNLYLAYSEIDFVGQFSQYGIAYTIGYGTSVASGEKEAGLFGGIGLARSNYNASISFIDESVHYSATWYMPYLRGTSVTYTYARNNSENIPNQNILSLGYSF